VRVSDASCGAMPMWPRHRVRLDGRKPVATEGGEESHP
jgi:hypothetical protein